MLENKYPQGYIAHSATNNNSVIIAPCFIGEHVQLNNSVVGPHVSIGANTVITDSVIKNSIIQTHSKITNAGIQNSMIGNSVVYNGKMQDLSMGDYSTEA